MAIFTDNTSSKGMTDIWVAKVDYGTTAYAGYTLVTASLLLTVKYGWDFVLNNGYSLSINGDSVSGSSCKIKQTDSSGKGVTYTLLTHSVKIYHTSNKDITISASINADNIYYNSGKHYVGTYSLSNKVSLVPLKTNCVAPTTFTASSNNFETDVTLAWSGAGGGTGNAIASYLIRYCTSSDNLTWNSWIDLTTVTSTSSSGTQTIDMSSKVSKGYYVKFSIRTQSSDANYASPWKESSSIRRQPYTKCTAPTTFTVGVDNFNTEITLDWSGAGGGTSNSISAYVIQYSVSSNGSTWGNWIALRTITTTNTFHSLTVDMQSYVSRGYYVKFQIQTQGSAGSSYYSDWKVSNIIRRDPKSVCSPPASITLTAASKLSNASKSVSLYVFEDSITIVWSSGKAGDGVTISGYILEYQTASVNSNGEMVWSDWMSQDTYSATTNMVDVDKSSVYRGDFIRFRVATKASDVNYNSSYVVSSSMKRNTLPQSLPADSIQHPKEFANGEKIALRWTPSVDVDNTGFYMANIEGYDIWGKIVNSNVTASAEMILPTSSYAFVKDDGFVEGTTIYRAKVSVKIGNDIVAGKAYTVVWDGIEYNNLIATETDYFGTIIGSQDILNGRTNTSEPFVIEFFTVGTSKYVSFYTDSTDSAHSIELKTYVSDNEGWTNIASIRNVSTVSAVSINIANNSSDVSISGGTFYNINNVSSQESLATLYNSVDNEQYIKLKIVPVDMFCDSTQIETLKSKALAFVVQRYDRSGMAFGIDGSWVDCQIYFGVNNQWVDVDVFAGVNDSWEQCNE